MRLDGIGKWLQIVSNLGVIVGLILVAIEINHSSDLVEVELRTNAMTDWVNSDVARFTDNINQTLAKSLLAPQELSIDEMIELDAYFSAYVNMGTRSNIAYKLGFSEYSGEQAARDVANMFGSAFAQAWWREKKEVFDADFVMLVDQYVSGVSMDRESELYRRLASELNE